MTRKTRRQRTIRIADFELPRGEVTIERLMAMPRADWEHLRNQINVRHEEDRTRPLAQCRLCEGPVYIRAPGRGNDDVPMFIHYPDSPRDCPWHDGPEMKLDDARAAQYQGHQESALHRRLCALLEQAAKADGRHRYSAIDTYLRPAIHKRGRWPDVYLDMGELGRFVLEVQLSKPFAPEIAARHLHYDREGVSLLWVFSELESPMPQGFRDVVTMQRGNAFVFDSAAQSASSERGTLVLSCYLESEGGWAEPRLVTLEDLQTGTGRAVFLEDRRSEVLEKRCRAERAIWWKAYRAALKSKGAPYYSKEFEAPWLALIERVPELFEWEEDTWPDYSDRGRELAATLFLLLTSISHSAATGEPRIYITRNTGDNAVLKMLNGKMAATNLRPCADLVATFLSRTSLASLLEVSSLYRILEESRSSVRQYGHHHPVWEAMARLFPDVLDGLIRAELSDLDRLPDWARAAVCDRIPIGAAEA